MVQVNNTPINLRVKFKKTGKLQYISHLDLVRTMHKIIVRAKLPLWYTEGFNTKPKMVFAAPLSIGTESVTEFVDIRLNEKIDQSEAQRRLNLNMTDEMQAIEVYYPERKLTEMKWLSYTIVIKTDCASENLAQKCWEILTSEKVEVEKKNKSGDIIISDIRPLIKSVNSTFDGVNIRISCILSADASAFLNPEYIIKALKRECGILSNEDLLSEHYSIMREAAYCDDMSLFR
jgi:radical SAM-linked protein